MKHEELRSLVEDRKEELIQLCSEMIRIPSENPPGENGCDDIVFVCIP